MANWAKFCDIIEYNQKKGNLVVKITTRFFFFSRDMESLTKLKLYLVPPEIDFANEYSIESVINFNELKQTAEILLNQVTLPDNIAGKSFIIDTSDIKCSAIENDLDNLVGKALYDEELGCVGNVVSVLSDRFQKLLVIDIDGEPAYVPYVNDIIIKVKNDKILARLPKGLLDIEKA